MTAREFNKKYKEFLIEGSYGLDVHDEEFIEWLDRKFEEYVKKEDFRYTQIKSKFGYGRFYCYGLTKEEIDEVENKITSLCIKMSTL